MNRTYISMLRGINVGGNKKIKMKSLREMYVSLGFSDVQSYIQSGNVIFKSEILNKESIQNIISEGILLTYGFVVPVLILTDYEMQIAYENNPFRTDATKNPSHIHFTFLSELPDNILLDKICIANYAPDEFSYSGETIYLYCPSGYGNTKLTNSFFENKLKITATTRNLKTVTELLVLSKK